MTRAYFRRRQRAMVQKDAATDVEISHRFNELRRELLDERAKTIDWWLRAAAIFLTLLGIVATIAGYISFERFRDIETEARGYAEKMQKLVGEAEEGTKRIKVLELLAADSVNNNPNEAGEIAESVQEDPTASPISQAIAAAALLQRRGNIEDAIEKWRAIANVVEGTDKEIGAQAWFSVGYLLHRDERDTFEAAIDAYDESIRLNPDHTNAYYNRGVAKNNLGRHEEAIADYDEAIRLNPDDPDAYYNRGVAKNNLGRHEEAIADYDEAIRLNPDHTNAYNNRGVAKNNLGRHEEAIADYDEAIRLNPDHTNAYNNRGVAKNNLGRHEEAIADYDEAIRLNPDDPDAYNNRGSAKDDLDRHEEAIADYDEAIRLKPDYAEAYYNRGESNISLSRVSEARRDFETAITLARDADDEALAGDAEHALKELLDKQTP